MCINSLELIVALVFCADTILSSLPTPALFSHRSALMLVISKFLKSF